MITSLLLSNFGGIPLEDPSMYINIVSSLQYCVLTQPIIAFLVDKLCHFLHSHTDVHWKDANRILRYLKGISSHGL